MDAGYVVIEDGTKMLPGSRRPDGTVRKERRIRAGYTPQDEQPVYQTTGTLAKRNVPKCPGLDPELASSGASSSSAKSKAAKKNEKRKAKKADGPPAASAGAAQPQAASPAKAAAAPPRQPAAAPPQQQQAAAPSAAAGAADPAGAAAGGLDKQIKALSKKVRQCQALVDRQAAGGEPLSQQEADKVAKMTGWQEEIRDLEHQLAKLLA